VAQTSGIFPSLYDNSKKKPTKKKKRGQ